MDAFKDFDPENPPGKPVRRLGPGETTCPLCGGELVQAHLVATGERKLFFLDCAPCDISTLNFFISLTAVSACPAQ